MSDEDLASELVRIAELPRLLVALDFDGVLAPIVDEPSSARPLPAADRAVRTLAGMPDTTVVMLSGRGRDDLAAVSGFGPPVHLVGSHGAEFDEELAGELGRGTFLTAEQEQRRDGLIDELRALVERVPGARVEVKPAGVAVHVRGVDEPEATALLDHVRSGPAHRDGVDATEGKAVIDLAVLTATKGAAVRALRTHLDVDAVLFAGDDVTDETAFAVLDGADVGIKVGDGATSATHRVESPDDMADALARLVRARQGDR